VGKLFVTILFALTYVTAFSQSYTVDVVDGWNIIVHTPADTSKKNPAIFFFPGTLEAGTDTADGVKNGPIWQVSRGYWDGKARGEEFWIFHVQPASVVTSAANYRPRVQTILGRHPSIDTNRIYLTGLSLGGGALMNLMNEATSGSIWWKYTAIVPMSIGSYVKGSNAPWGSQIQHFTQLGGRYYGLIGAGDTSARPLTKFYHDTLNIITPGSAQIYYYSGGHCCWETEYRPTTKRLNSENIYEWMLKHSKKPYANVGQATINTSGSSVTLNGIVDSIPGGFNGRERTITWSKVSGGSATITSPSSDTTTVTGLTTGTYVFRLTSDNAAGGQMATKDVMVNVTQEEDNSTYFIKMRGRKLIIQP